MLVFLEDVDIGLFITENSGDIIIMDKKTEHYWRVKSWNDGWIIIDKNRYLLPSIEEYLLSQYTTRISFVNFKIWNYKIPEELVGRFDVVDMKPEQIKVIKEVF